MIPNSIQRISVFYQILICYYKKNSKKIPVFFLALAETFPPGGLGDSSFMSLSCPKAHVKGAMNKFREKEALLRAAIYSLTPPLRIPMCSQCDSSRKTVAVLLPLVVLGLQPSPLGTCYPHGESCTGAWGWLDGAGEVLLQQG